jgi:myo-inositol-1(or 4)-monophosphatase
VSSEPVDEWIDACVAAARSGGRALVDWRGRFTAREKAPSDLVTDADLASQNVIRRELADRFPDYAFVGEEPVPDAHPIGEHEFVWVVDPLDGTTNYVHGFPCYGVSVALVRASELLAGVIYDPVNDECFSAALGRGAWCNGVRIRTSHVTSVEKSLVAVSLPPRAARDAVDMIDMVEVAQVTQGIRRTGSAALNLAFVARGQLDAVWAAQINPWDVAAGVLLVREAGGVVTGRNGKPFDIWHPHYLAAAGPPLHDALLDVLSPFKG